MRDTGSLRETEEVIVGACNFITFGEGRTREEAFRDLVEEALWEYGHDPYNGTISTCDLSRRPTVVIQKTWGPLAQKRAVKHAEEDGWGKKWEARVLDCGRVKGHRGVHMWAFYGWAAM